MFIRLITHLYLYMAVIPASGGSTASASCAKPKLLGIFEPWYQYLNVQKQVVTDKSGDTFTNCSFNITNAQVLGGHSPFLLIALAILDDMVRLAGLVAVGFVIYGGIQYIISQGSPDGTKKAQQTILNALIGVALAVLAAGIVSFIGNRLG